jgi:uncharacterized membrane protein
MSGKLTSRVGPIPKAMLGAWGWVVIMVVMVVVAFVIIHYLKTL